MDHVKLLANADMACIGLKILLLFSSFYWQANKLASSRRKYFEKDDHEEERDVSEGITEKEAVEGEEGIDDETNDVTERLQCMVLHKKDPSKRGNFPEIPETFRSLSFCEEFSWENYGLWRQELKNRAARLEKQLKARWALEDLIEEQLDRYHAHYYRSMVPARPKDVAQLLMPKWAPPQELASLAWFGDWRPSAILDLLRALARSSSSLSSSGGAGAERLLSQLRHEVGIEEKVLDEAMAEIQATCVLHLPFGPKGRNRPSGNPALGWVQSEFKKIERVVAKAQKLRFKALETVVNKVLSQTEAAEFLVAFAGIQDMIHQFALNQRLRKGPVSVRMKAIGSC
ncbi:uncharacterized protein LOC131158515 [Malania oleifera]|uniref:uncharacterized protein LOC131158515 n=1 Tax=Malania oleifera TaxID=397392 RepID=UPI0025ADC194|nr:uncharacterized protein LOC131158515 [Malania oleifera]